MRTKSWDELEEIKSLMIVDWKDTPEEVLKAVDKQLREFGLEVVMDSGGNDSYGWVIEKRQKKKKKKN